MIAARVPRPRFPRAPGAPVLSPHDNVRFASDTCPDRCPSPVRTARTLPPPVSPRRSSRRRRRRSRHDGRTGSVAATGGTYQSVIRSRACTMTALRAIVGVCGKYVKVSERHTSGFIASRRPRFSRAPFLSAIAARDTIVFYFTIRLGFAGQFIIWKSTPTTNGKGAPDKMYRPSPCSYVSLTSSVMVAYVYSIASDLFVSPTLNVYDSRLHEIHT